MQKIGILVDTTSDISLDLQNSKNIKVVPLQIIFNDSKTYRDVYEISYDEIMSAIENYEIKTSLPTGEDIIKAFDEFVAEGYTHIITLSISGEISGTYNLVKNISESYKDKLTIENIDTRSTTFGGIGYFAQKSLALIESGKDFDEIKNYLNENISKQKIFFAVETLKYLIRGGRVNKIAGAFGEMLDVKPILSLDDGKIGAVDKVRGRKKSISKIIDLSLFDKDNIEKMFVLHGDKLEEAELIKSKIKEVVDIDVEIRPLGSLVSVHAGPGLIGIVSIYK